MEGLERVAMKMSVRMEMLKHLTMSAERMLIDYGDNSHVVSKFEVLRDEYRSQYKFLLELAGELGIMDVL